MKKTLFFIIPLVVSAVLFWSESSQAAILTLRPDGDIIKNINWPFGETHWDKVADSSDFTYVYTISASPVYDLYSLGNHTTESGNINSVKVYIRSKKGGSYSGQTTLAKTVISAGGTEYRGGTNYLLPTNATVYSTTYALNPKTNSLWNWSDIDALRAGVEMADPLSELAFTFQVYVEVDYIVQPAVSTQVATNIFSSSATGNGNITAIGGENATQRGVEWGTVSGSYPNSATDVGSFGAGSFTKAMTGLSPNIIYYYRAKAFNSAGWGYGQEQSFTTASLPCQAHNVSGWAWSENVGWISLACQNTVTIGSGVNFGVDINESSGNFTGYGWSENVGWIDFAPGGPYPTSPNYSACINFPGNGETCDEIGNYNIGGWARVIANGGGWDGWIKLRGNNYGLSVNTGNGELSNYAWSDMVIGWVSFKGPNYGAITKLVFNKPPDKPTTFETDWNRCAFQGSAVPTLSWTYSDPDGDPQTAYEVELDDNSSFNAPKFNHLVNSASTSYVLNLRDDDENPDNLPSSMQDYQLDWNATYFWRVRVRDDHGNWSGWSNSSQSKTDKHASPWVNFSWAPAEPTQNETTEFTDQTQPFGGTTIVSRAWSIVAGNGVFVDGTGRGDANPHMQFSTPRNTLRLEVTDSDNYTCYADKDVVVQLPVPNYKEIPPIIWLRRIIAALLVFPEWLK